MISIRALVPCHVAWPALLVATLLPAGALFGSACGSAASHAGRVLTDDRVVSCELLLDELKQIDVDASSEERLTRAMNQADEARPGCAEAWTANAGSLYERTLAAHLDHQLALRALVIETVLSERFDQSSHVCEIQREVFQYLLADVASLEEALSSNELADDERRQLTQLRDLDLESLDVLMVAHASFCRD